MTPNKTNAGNGSSGICRVIDACRLPSPDSEHSTKEARASMKIGRITSVTADGPKRNVVMTDAPDTAFCSIAIPAKPITKSKVTSFQLHGSRVGLWGAAVLLILACLVSILFLRRFAFSLYAILAPLLCVSYLIARYHRLTLYSVIVHTSDPSAPRISFYRTFDAFDFALVLDWLTWSVGDHPRTCTGAMKHHQNREP